MELPRTVIDVMEYSGDRVFAIHYAFGGKYACLRGIAEFPVLTVCCFRHPASIASGAAGRLVLSVVAKSPYHSLRGFWVKIYEKEIPGRLARNLHTL
jgi:hypothetical protein